MSIGMNRRLAVSGMAGALGGLLFGYDIGAISSAAPGLRAHFALSPSGLGVAVSAALFGTIAGSVMAGFVADAINRRATLLISALLYIFASLGTASAFHFQQFAIFRFISGIAIGVISVVAPMYLAEIAPSQARGRLVGSFQINVGIGVVLAFAWSYLASLHVQPAEAWRYSVACGALPALLCVLLLFKASPSPRWLALQRRFDDAGVVLATLGSANPDADQASLIASFDEFGASRRPSLFSRRYARPILLASSIAIFNQLTGANVLLYYILDVFSELGSGHLNGRKDAILVAVSSLVVTVMAVSVIDRAGRKPLLLAGAAGMGVCLVLLPAIRHMLWPAWSVVVVLVCYNSFFAFSQGTVIWVYLSEIFPLSVRSRGQSLGSTVHWVANALITGSFPAIARIFGMKVLIAFAVIMALQFLVILFIYPETQRIGLERLASDISGQITTKR